MFIRHGMPLALIEWVFTDIKIEYKLENLSDKFLFHEYSGDIWAFICLCPWLHGEESWVKSSASASVHVDSAIISVVAVYPWFEF